MRRTARSAKSTGDAARATQTDGAWLRVRERNSATTRAARRPIIGAGAGAAAAVPPIA
jgi:hypothetical protein